MEVDWMGVQREVEVGLARRMRRELQVEPLILCLVQPAPGGTPAYKLREDVSSETRTLPKGRDSSRNSSSSASPNPVKTVASDGDALNEKTDASKAVGSPNPESKSEMPAGRTRRRRSAVA